MLLIYMLQKRMQKLIYQHVEHNLASQMSVTDMHLCCSSMRTFKRFLEYSIKIEVILNLLVLKAIC
jgi:hypothetical protein